MLVHLLTLVGRRLRSVTSLVLLASLGTPLLARAPEPRLRIPLEPLGLQHLPAQFIVAGSSLLTVHYVDDTHLLVTFAVRRLMNRLPDDPPGDDDRTVDALLLELPSGKVNARTSWRLHDTGRYLWSLGHGRFMLRVHDRITTFAPVANLAAGDAFQQAPLLDTQRRVAVVMVSPDTNLLTVETVDAKRVGTSNTTAAPSTPLVPRRSGVLIPRTGPPSSDADREQRPAFQINFYRLIYPGIPSQRILVQSAGIVGANHPVALPADASGFLNIIDEGSQHWAFNYNTYAGKTSELAPFDSNCQPFPEFVSPSEFVAFGCRNGQDPQILGGFNLRGEQMWQQVLSGSYISPSFSFSPLSDRFAFSRVLTTGTLPAVGEPVEGQLLGQTVTIYQTDSGRQVFSINCTPVSRSGENFALAPDGMELAVIRDSVVELYRLPDLTPRDRAGLQKAQSLAPPVGEEQVRIYLPLNLTSARLAALNAAKSSAPPSTGISLQPAAPIASSPVAPNSEPPVADPGPASPGTAGSISSGAPRSRAPAAETSAPHPGADANTSGDPVTPRRKPPTLYNPPDPSGTPETPPR